MADINEFIQNHKKPPVRNVECYTILGQQNYLDDMDRPRIDDEDDALAKSVNVDNKPTRFYIKVGTYGKIYNPIGLYSEGQSKKFLAKIGRKEFEFKEVNQKIFDLYINFLSTKNTAWLVNAEREMS
jgi:hypothetical protein